MTVNPEQKVRFDTLPGEPRNADAVAIAESPRGTFAISIEAKADEPFDFPVAAVLRRAIQHIAQDVTTNEVTRIQQLAEALLPKRKDGMASLGELRSGTRRSGLAAILRT